MSAAITLTLPGEPVTAEVTWEQVRAYLRAEGWNRTDGNGLEMWKHTAHPLEAVWTGDGQRIGDAVTWLARIASVSPGAMLLRITDRAPAPNETLRIAEAARSWADAIHAKQWRTSVAMLDSLYEATKPGRKMHTNQRGMIDEATIARRAAEAMREMCAALAIQWGDQNIASRIRTLPLEPQPSDGLVCGCVRPAFCALCAASEVLP